ncbi:MAG TPA: PD-(D/E)XK nuclease family protein, partial [Bacteroidales bacterium]|nr:PD-(D/E)XK nuclease family protein [Bacteroidales bacterium]
MKSFLEEVAENLMNESTDLSDLEIIVPNQRTGLFLKKALMELADTACWMPKITTISDVFLNNSSMHQAEELLLIHRLYRIFVECTKSNESFDDFYYWGEIILNDFDDIDKYLVDASKLFSTIKDIREIDSKF